MPRPRKEQSLPGIISKQDVVRLINQAGKYKQQVFVCFVYATGLRLSEALNVKFEDIDRDRLQIHVRRGKGAKDRIIHIPECLLEVLTDYYKYYKPENYLFNGHKKGRKYSNSAAQWIMRQARKNIKFTKRASIHTLRHAYATHHLESGTDLVYLKSQLGHKHLKTTEKYIHLCKTDWS
jgi:integrase/recombinase XerD